LSKELLAEKETEVRIMKRERDSVMTEKMELTIENRKMKVTIFRLVNNYLFRLI
jgi:hypothetical protein